MKKRSTSVKVLLGSAALVALAACEDDRVDTSVFESEAQCVMAAKAEGSFFDEDDCEDAFEAAEAEHRRVAPRYNSKALCEQEHGVGNCGGDVHIHNDGGSSFMPFMMGYMMANAFDNGSSSRHYSAAQPVYKTKSGMYATANNSVRFNALNTTARVSPSTVKAKPMTTLGKPPLTKTTVKSTGGFGASKTSSSSRSTSSSRSFGG